MEYRRKKTLPIPTLDDTALYFAAFFNVHYVYIVGIT
jgi:hypothetical protein